MDGLGLAEAPPDIAFRLDRPFMLLNPLLRLHHMARVRHNRAIGWEVRVATNGCRPTSPFVRALVRIERRSLVEPDCDGLTGGAKPLLDALLPTGKPYVSVRKGVSKWMLPHPTGLAIIADDSPACLVLQTLSVRVKKRADQCTLVRIYRLSAA